MSNQVATLDTIISTTISTVDAVDRINKRRLMKYAEEKEAARQARRAAQGGVAQLNAIVEPNPPEMVYLTATGAALAKAVAAKTKA